MAARGQLETSNQTFTWTFERPLRPNNGLTLAIMPIDARILRHP